MNKKVEYVRSEGSYLCRHETKGGKDGYPMAEIIKPRGDEKRFEVLILEKYAPGEPIPRGRVAKITSSFFKDTLEEAEREAIEILDEINGV